MCDGEPFPWSWDEAPAVGLRAPPTPRLPWIEQRDPAAERSPSANPADEEPPKPVSHDDHWRRLAAELGLDVGPAPEQPTKAESPLVARTALGCANNGGTNRIRFDTTIYGVPVRVVVMPKGWLRVTLFGVPLRGVLRWMGEAGWTVAEARVVVHRLLADLADGGSYADGVLEEGHCGVGRKGSGVFGRVPQLTAYQAETLDALRSSQLAADAPAPAPSPPPALDPTCEASGNSSVDTAVLTSPASFAGTTPLVRSSQRQALRGLQPLNLQDRTFGRLTARRMVGRGSRGVVWECDCSCGATGVRVTATNLYCGHVKSCGCPDAGPVPTDKAAQRIITPPAQASERDPSPAAPWPIPAIEAVGADLDRRAGRTPTAPTLRELIRQPSSGNPVNDAVDVLTRLRGRLAEVRRLVRNQQLADARRLIRSAALCAIDMIATIDSLAKTGPEPVAATAAQSGKRVEKTNVPPIDPGPAAPGEPKRQADEPPPPPPQPSWSWGHQSGGSSGGGHSDGGVYGS